MIAEIFWSAIGLYPLSTVSWLAFVALIAGISRGLTGFGAGMIFVPLAAGLVGPMAAIGLIFTMDSPVILPTARAALRRAEWRETLLLASTWLVATPFGLWLLGWLNPLTVRWAVCLMIMMAMVLLIGGWTYRGLPTPRLALMTGVIAGITGGLTGLSGPPIVMLWLAAASSSARNVRDNLNLFFMITLAVNAVLLPWYGILTWPIFLLGLLLAIPYMGGYSLGAYGFRFVSDTNYRRAAYFVIGTAALLALPLLDGLLGRK